MDHAVVGTGCIIAARAVVLENWCATGFLYAGVPIKIKCVTQTGLKRTANHQLYAGWLAS
jgi:carbonic anhydrase/acetyltransferase-like protein (isoleucine patch superfamily)